MVAASVLLASPVARGEVEETRATLRQHVLKLINRERQHYNLPAVELDLQVSAFADGHCRQQIRTRTTGHYTTDGLPPYMRYSFAGGNDGISENAAAWSADYTFNERALYEMAGRSHDAMMAELPPNDGHKKTILDPHATHVGIGLAWERGEFRLVHEFIRRYVEWVRPLPRSATLADTIVAAARPMRGVAIEAISVHHEPLPQPMAAHVASAIATYSLPKKRRDYLPRLYSDYTRRFDGTIEIVRREYADGGRGDFHVARDGAFSFTIPFTDGPGVYTIVVWVKRAGTERPIAASNVSIRVDDGAGGAGISTGAR